MKAKEQHSDQGMSLPRSSFYLLIRTRKLYHLIDKIKIRMRVGNKTMPQKIRSERKRLDLGIMNKKKSSVSFEWNRESSPSEASMQQ